MEEIIINVDAFVVPNRLHSCLDYSETSQNRVVEHILRFNKLNGTDVNVITEPMVQLWYSGKETCGSENLYDHGFRVGSSSMHMGSWSEFIPVSVFQNKVEGDIVPIKVIAYKNGESDHKYVVTLNCRLSQSDYRYRREGAFEDCLSKLIHEYKTRHADAAVTT